MKTLLLAAMLLSNVVHAGHPTEDYVIDAIRDAFKSGEIPASNDRLLPNQPWICGHYSTSKGQQSGHVGVTLGGAKFKITMRGIESSTAYLVRDLPYTPYNNSLSSHSIKNGVPHLYNFVREVHDGLIIETAVVSDNVTLPSAIMPHLQTIAYQYCLAYERNSGRRKVFNYAWERILDY